MFDSEQIRNSLRCQVKDCGEVALGMFAQKWMCGKCILKIENKIREDRKRYMEFTE